MWCSERKGPGWEVGGGVIAFVLDFHYVIWHADALHFNHYNSVGIRRAFRCRRGAAFGLAVHVTAAG